MLLVGDATFDPRNFLGLGDFDFVPTRLIDTASMETASDDWFVDADVDGVPELAIGRWPVRTAAAGRGGRGQDARVRGNRGLGRGGLFVSDLTTSAWTSPGRARPLPRSPDRMPVAQFSRTGSGRHRSGALDKLNAVRSW